MLQQLEAPHDATVSVNDCFRPVCRYFDRVARPEQLVDAALAALRVLTDPAETGAVCLALPEDVQTEVVEVPDAFLEERTWTIYRRPPAPAALARAAELIRAAERPLVVAGGGVIYSEATGALRAFADATGIPVGETQAGRGALPSAHPSALGAIGATGTPAANRLAREADLVIGVGTRWSDFTTASKSAFQDPGVRFVERQRRRASTPPSTRASRSRRTRGSRSTLCARRSPATAPATTGSDGRPTSPRRGARRSRGSTPPATGRCRARPR